MIIITFFLEGKWWAEYEGPLGILTASGETKAEAERKLQVRITELEV